MSAMLRYLKQEGKDTAGQYRSYTFIPLLDLNHLTSVNPKSGKSNSGSHFSIRAGWKEALSLAAYLLELCIYSLSPEMRPFPSLLQIIF